MPDINTPNGNSNVMTERGFSERVARCDKVFCYAVQAGVLAMKYENAESQRQLLTSFIVTNFSSQQNAPVLRAIIANIHNILYVPNGGFGMKPYSDMRDLSLDYINKIRLDPKLIAADGDVFLRTYMTLTMRALYPEKFLPTNDTVLATPLKDGKDPRIACDIPALHNAVQRVLLEDRIADAIAHTVAICKAGMKNDSEGKALTITAHVFGDAIVAGMQKLYRVDDIQWSINGFQEMMHTALAWTLADDDVRRRYGSYRPSTRWLETSNFVSYLYLKQMQAYTTRNNGRMPANRQEWDAAAVNRYDLRTLQSIGLSPMLQADFTELETRYFAALSKSPFVDQLSANEWNQMRSLNGTRTLRGDIYIDPDIEVMTVADVLNGSSRSVAWELQVVDPESASMSAAMLRHSMTVLGLVAPTEGSNMSKIENFPVNKDNDGYDLSNYDCYPMNAQISQVVDHHTVTRVFHRNVNTEGALMNTSVFVSDGAARTNTVGASTAAIAKPVQPGFFKDIVSGVTELLDPKLSFVPRTHPVVGDATEELYEGLYAEDMGEDGAEDAEDRKYSLPQPGTMSSLWLQCHPQDVLHTVLLNSAFDIDRLAVVAPNDVANALSSGKLTVRSREGEAQIWNETSIGYCTRNIELALYLLPEWSGNAGVLHKDNSIFIPSSTSKVERRYFYPTGKVGQDLQIVDPAGNNWMHAKLRSHWMIVADTNAYPLVHATSCIKSVLFDYMNEWLHNDGTSVTEEVTRHVAVRYQTLWLKALEHNAISGMHAEIGPQLAIELRKDLSRHYELKSVIFRHCLTNWLVPFTLRIEPLDMQLRFMGEKHGN